MTEPVRITHRLNHPPGSVWKALTDKEQMKQWYFDMDDFRPEPGFEFSFQGEAEGRKYLHQCRVVEAIPEKKIAYTWKYMGYDGSSLVSFEIQPAENGSNIILTHEGLESFPVDNPDFDRKNFEAGWKSLITDLLEKFLDKNQDN